MLIPTDLSKREKRQYVKAHDYMLAKPPKRTHPNKHPGLRKTKEQIEEERLAAETLAEEERLAAETLAEEERLAEEVEAEAKANTEAKAEEERRAALTDEEREAEDAEKESSNE